MLSLSSDRPVTPPSLPREGDPNVRSNLCGARDLISVTVQNLRNPIDPVRNTLIVVFPLLLSLSGSLRMSKDEKAVGIHVNVETLAVNEGSSKFHNADDELLAKLGYKAEFKREFTVRNPGSFQRAGLMV